MVLVNSWLQDWLDFNGTVSRNLAPCAFGENHYHSVYHQSFKDYSQVSCALVCHEPSSLFDPISQNLVTCGLWAIVVTAIQVSQPQANTTIYTSELQKNVTGVHLAYESFEGNGLSMDDTRYLSMVTDGIANCLSSSYDDSKSGTVAGDGTVPAACTKARLFVPPSKFYITSHPIESSLKELTKSTLYSLDDCLQGICSPRNFDPDLAGIRVFASFVIQVAIANARLWVEAQPASAATTRQTSSSFHGHPTSGRPKQIISGWHVKREWKVLPSSSGISVLPASVGCAAD